MGWLSLQVQNFLKGKLQQHNICAFWSHPSFQIDYFKELTDEYACSYLFERTMFAFSSLFQFALLTSVFQCHIQPIQEQSGQQPLVSVLWFGDCYTESLKHIRCKESQCENSTSPRNSKWSAPQCHWQYTAERTLLLCIHTLISTIIWMFHKWKIFTSKWKISLTSDENYFAANNETWH